MSKYDSLLTEQRNPASMSLDTMTTAEVLALMNREDKAAVAAVEAQIPNIAKAVDLVVESFASGGRLIYIGAGHERQAWRYRRGRVPADLRRPPHAGAGAHRRRRQGHAPLRGRRRGLARGRRGGYPQEARRPQRYGDGDYRLQHGAFCRRRDGDGQVARREDGLLLLQPDREAASGRTCSSIPLSAPRSSAGSTRLKAGTATKLTLNMLTTASMVRMGKVYENLMVDLRPWCYKLELRARRIIRTLTGASEDRAEGLMLASGNDLKVALVMQIRNVPRREAHRLLVEAGGDLRSVMEAGKGKGEA